MNGICIKTPWLYRHFIFPPCFPLFFSSYAAIPQSCGRSAPTVPPPSDSLPSFHLPFPPLLPRCAPALAPSRRLCRGVSEWWSFSGPREWSCGFSVPHIRGRALAFCMLQEFGLAEHQALTTSSPALAAASAGQTNYLSPAHSIHEITLMSHCLYLYSLTFMRTYVCFYCIHFLNVPRRRTTWSQFILAVLKESRSLSA